MEAPSQAAKSFSASEYEEGYELLRIYRDSDVLLVLSEVFQEYLTREGWT
jgi:hypothetical protein